MTRLEDRARNRLMQPRQLHAAVAASAKTEAIKNTPAGHEHVGFDQAGQQVTRKIRPERASGKQIQNPDGSHFPASRGLATGRVTPYAPHRPNRMEAIEVHEGLRDPGAAGPNQGNLFSPSEVDRLTVSDDEMARRTGVPSTPSSAGKGFLSRVGVTPSQPHGSVAEARQAGDMKAVKSITKRKMEVISRHGQEIGPTARRPGPPVPGQSMAESVRRRGDYLTPGAKDPEWYSKHAPAAIEHAAQQTGTTTPQMRRATAYGSPQMPWTSGHPQDDTYRMNNIDFARSMAEHVEKHRGNVGAQFTPENMGQTYRAPAVWAGKPIVSPESGEQMTTKVQTEGNRIKTASAFMGDDPSKHIKSDSQKVRNFDVALGRGSSSRWARRQAANAYTSDTWDERTMGIKSHYDWTGATSAGGYDMAATTGRRAAMKAGKTPSRFQEHIWTARRGEEESQPQQQMFKQKKGGKETVRTPSTKTPKPPKAKKR